MYYYILCLECFHCYVIIDCWLCCTFPPMVALINHLLTYLLIMQNSIRTMYAQFYKHCSYTAKFRVAKIILIRLIYAAASVQMCTLLYRYCVHLYRCCVHLYSSEVNCQHLHQHSCSVCSHLSAIPQQVNISFVF